MCDEHHELSLETFSQHCGYFMICSVMLNIRSFVQQSFVNICLLYCEDAWFVTLIPTFGIKVLLQFSVTSRRMGTVF
jgi:hypothetical protein